MAKRLTQEEVSSRIKEFFQEDVELISEYINKRSDITLKCNNCGYIWTAHAQNLIRKPENNFHRCPNCSRDILIELKCDYCGKIFTRMGTEVKRSYLHFCSKECGNKYKNLFIKKDNSSNYRNLAFKEYQHICACCGYDEDERILEVHHIDGNRKNNNINNLRILCPNCHRKITLKYYKLDINNNVLIKLK